MEREKRERMRKNQEFSPNKFFNKSYQANALWIGQKHKNGEEEEEECHMRTEMSVQSFSKISAYFFFIMNFKEKL